MMLRKNAEQSKEDVAVDSCLRMKDNEGFRLEFIDKYIGMFFLNFL